MSCGAMRNCDFTKDFKMLIYFDNCCFNRPFDSQTSEIIKQETQAILSIQQTIINVLNPIDFYKEQL
jgi:hypothetical protein